MSVPLRVVGVTENSLEFFEKLLTNQLSATDLSPFAFYDFKFNNFISAQFLAGFPINFSGDKKSGVSLRRRAASLARRLGAGRESEVQRGVPGALISR